MTPERWQRVKELFDAAVERAGAERASFLDHACAGDLALRKDVDDLLSSDEQTHVMIDQPVSGVAAELLVEHQSASILGRTIGAYRFVKIVGRGGMGEVYLAHDARLDRPVAIKLLLDSFIHDSERTRRFQQEARAASSLNHPNIVTIHEVVESEGLRFIVSEFVEGKTLRELMKEELKVDQVLDVVIQAAGALSAAHNAGIVHRDIKPENIMVRPDGYVKVLDFGLAKLTERGHAPRGLPEDVAISVSEMGTKPGTVMGTVKYMSPEQARGEKVDHRTDIFSLGVVLYETITGRAPFEGETASHTIVAILEQEPPPVADYVPEAPAELQRVVDNSLRKKREDRYQTVGGMLNDLQELRQEVAFRARQKRHSGSVGDALQAQPGTAIWSRIRKHQSRAVLWSALLVVAFSALAFAVYEYIRARRAPVSQSLKMTRITANGKIFNAAITQDGKYISYVAGASRQQGLWVMQATTASHSLIVPPIAEATYWGLTFSPAADYVYYVRNVGTGPFELYRVPTLGGSPKRLVVNIDTAVTFSPDGDRLAFGRILKGMNESSLMVANADGTDERTLATRLAPDLFNFNGLQKISWSPDGETIVCPAGNTEYPTLNKSELVEVRVKDGTQRPITRQKWYDLRQVAWLGDGSGLVMVARDQQSSPVQLWHLSYPTGDVRKLSNDFSNYDDISVSADSSTIVTVQREQLSNVWVAPGGDATRARQITDNRNDGIAGISWTPDGRIVYSSNVSGNADIWIMDADGRNRQRLTDNIQRDARPSVSPDGRYVVYVSVRGDRWGIRRMDIDGGNSVPLTEGNGEVDPHCSPDGRWVYYRSLWSKNGVGGLWKVPLDGGDPVLLLEKWVIHPAVSPDQKLLAYGYSDRQMNPQFGVAVGPVDGGQPVKLFDISQDDGALFCWTPDGRALAYTDDRSLNVWSQPLEGGKPVQLTDFKTDQTLFFAWSRDGKQLALARGTRISDVVMITDFK
jgi:serine/threonine protein kinase/Tol biopolymer transport system component